jgi:polysaccharide biosynthesis/export protein
LKNNPWPNLHFSLKHFPVAIAALFVTMMTTSCGNVKNLQYLNGNFDTANLKSVNIPEPIIQKGDLLAITVYSDDPLATAAVTNPALNNTNVLSTVGKSDNAASMSGTSALQGFVVNQSGEVILYKLGAVTAAGKTKKELADNMASMYASQGLLKNPFVDVRFMNYKFTIIGEVQHPGTFSIPADKVSAFEAVGLAGDLTVYGRRDNVLVVREVNGTRQFGKLNLQDPNVFLSPYYYLQQNDLVIVDVAKNKSVVNNQSKFQAITIATGLASIVAVFVSIITR